MIVELPDTTTSHVSRTLVTIREDGGAVALGRVLTLIVVTRDDEEEDAIDAANDASREHPMRLIVLSSSSEDANPGTAPRLDAQIRVGGDAGASEVVVLRAVGDAASDPEGLVMSLLLPDAPVVVWWPGAAPENPSSSPLGRIAHRRITDAAASPSPFDAVRNLHEFSTPGDTDFTWTRLTLWRAQLAAVLDGPPYEAVDRVEVHGSAASPSTELLAAWLGLSLDAPAEIVVTPPGWQGVRQVRLERESGPIILTRVSDSLARLEKPDNPTHDISLPRRGLRDCLAEELRRLDPDDLFGEVVQGGLLGFEQRGTFSASALRQEATSE